MKAIEIGRPEGAGHPPYIIAAVDCLAVPSFEAALAAVDAAADCECDAVKFTAIRWAWAAQLFHRAETRGLGVFATPLDDQEVARLDWLGVHAFHLCFDWCDLELVARAARTGKPIVMAVGEATPDELAEVVAIATAHGRSGIVLVQTVLDVDLAGLDVRHVSAVGICDLMPGVPACEAPCAAATAGRSTVN